MAASWLELHQCWFKTCTASMLVRLSSPGTPKSCHFKTSPLQLPPTWDGRWWVERFGPGNPPSPAAVTVRTSCICSFDCLVMLVRLGIAGVCILTPACQVSTPTLPSSPQGWEPLSRICPIGLDEMGSDSVQGMTGHRTLIPKAFMSHLAGLGLHLNWGNVWS